MEMLKLNLVKGKDSDDAADYARLVTYFGCLF